MKVLQICNSFLHTRVHYNLFLNLKRTGVCQTILSYTRRTPSSVLNDESRLINDEDTRTICAPIIKRHHHYFYHNKIQTLFKDASSRLDMRCFDIIHASTLFADGGVAFLLNKKFGIPYIVAVRNTDINSYFHPKAFFTWPMGRKILRNASKIIFISPASINKFKSHIAIRGIFQNLSDKIVICPNGIDDYWLDNKTSTVKNNHNVCYVGDFTPNKNVGRLIQAILNLRLEISDIHLDIVGGGSPNKKVVGDDSEAIMSLIDKNPSAITFYGRINDKLRLKHIYEQNSVFAMPSIFETFGLVYVEALSQNLRVLYTKGQGVDGVFDGKLGESVDPMSVESITSALRNLILNPLDYNDNSIIDFEAFRWKNIAKRYKTIYDNIIKHDS